MHAGLETDKSDEDIEQNTKQLKNNQVFEGGAQLVPFDDTEDKEQDKQIS